MSIVDDAFAAVPREHWSDGPLWRSPNDLEAAAWLANIGKAPSKPSPEARAAQRYCAWAELGLTVAQIAEREGVSHSTVRWGLLRNGVTAAPAPRVRGTLTTPEQRDAVLALAAAAEPARRTEPGFWHEVGAQVGISREAARTIWRRARKEARYV